MKTKLLTILSFISILIVAGCTGKTHFIQSETERNEINQAFEQKKTFFSDSTLFSVFNQEMQLQEEEAMKFLYAYMPIGDIADYSGDFYLKNVQASFKAKGEMPWGSQIPEIIFRHFVLPVRVNNENLDESRMVFYDELKNRVKNLSLHDAVLEVNHWCHEKVIYTPSDSRTSSPLASVKTAYGRCGEESTFTVAALRSVGIPARQVYTPRWAHTDDNHAWVEAWVDGTWFFLGACEPEPVLNLGWFNSPASRGMLMHTKVFGRYKGPEDVMDTTACYTEINIIENYAPKAKATIKVVDKNEVAVEGALVEFKLYNYAEFNTVARKNTNKEGSCILSAGKGDMLVWASKDGKFGFNTLSFGKEEQLTIVLDKEPGDLFTLDLDITPPIEGSIRAEVTEEQKVLNAKRLLEEDSIRNVYVATFISEEKVKNLAKELAISEEKTIAFLSKSRGNWVEIEKFLREAPQDKRSQAVTLLEAVSDKDLRDTPASILLDHLNHTPAIPENLYKESNLDRNLSLADFQSQLFQSYVLNARVSNEFLTPYKSFFAQQFDKTHTQSFQANPQALVEWVKDNIQLYNELNPQTIPVMPIGVWKARIADIHSRNIFFVAVARSIGLPSRIERVTGKVQYYKNQWQDVDFETANQQTLPQGSVTASYTPIKSLDNPKYYSHFTIAKIKSDGTLQTLRFERSGAGDMGLGGTWAGLFKNSSPLDEGNYLLVSGSRMASGKVLAHIASFPIKSGEKTSVELVMRENTDDVQVIGNINSEAKFTLAENKQETSILNTTGRGYFIIGILGSRQEPTNHAMRDIALLKKDFEQWDRSMILLFKNEQSFLLFDKKEFGNLPGTITYGIDSNSEITNMIASAMNLPSSDSLPIFIIADTFGRVIFVSQGYTIGLGEQMMKVIHKL